MDESVDEGGYDWELLGCARAIPLKQTAHSPGTGYMGSGANKNAGLSSHHDSLVDNRRTLGWLGLCGQTNNTDVGPFLHMFASYSARAACVCACVCLCMSACMNACVCARDSPSSIISFFLKMKSKFL